MQQLIWSLSSRHRNGTAPPAGVMVSLENPHSIQWRHDHWALMTELTPSLMMRGVKTALNPLKIALSLMSSPTELQRLVILNYKNADGEELVGLALELVEESNGGIQVRVLRDSNLVSCVSVVPLIECRVDDSQDCDCCDSAE